MQRRWIADGAVACLLTAIGVIEVLAAHGIVDAPAANPDATIGPLPVDLALAAATTLPVAVRRAWPTAVPIAVYGLQVAANLLILHHMPFFAGLGALAVLGYTFGRGARPDLVRWGWIGPLAWAATFPVLTPEARTLPSILYTAFLLTAPWAIGWIIRRLLEQRRALEAALAEVSSLESVRREAALLAQRAHIAREMHDVLAHGVSVMVVQAGAARIELPEGSPASASLIAVEETGRRVLRELRRTVGLLRGPDANHGVAPAPGLAELPELAETMRRAGLHVDLAVEDGGRTDPSRELVAYRVVQEALTNCLRHSGASGTSARVRVTRGDALRVHVRDSGRADSGSDEGGGFGLAGLRERLALYDGSLRAERCDGGFEVEAVIPWEATA
ncbi:sensor histidine kinase [Agromyces sp. SYSU T00266]|uniref:sensor histidine kinase n=1 Tax=Agromyces zhanjiangensis TaxID=3158562 RepID=UPI003396DF67